MPRTPPRVEIKEQGSKISKPTIVVAVPDVGLVGTIACSYIVDQLKLEPKGYIDSDLAPPVMLVHDSVPTLPVRMFGKDGLIIVLSEVPLPPKFSLELAKEIACWAKEREAKVVVGVSGAPSRKREESQGEGVPTVTGISNDPVMLKKVEAIGAQLLENGAITGFYASLMKYCSVNGQANVTILGESMLQFPDPAAAVAVIGVLSAMLAVKVDAKPLQKESEEVRMKTRDLMRQTQAAQQPTVGSPSAYR